MQLLLGSASNAHLCDLYWPIPVVVLQVLDPVIEDLEISWVYLQAGNIILSGVVFILVYICLLHINRLVAGCLMQLFP